MVLVRAVREVEARDVHARGDEAAKALHRVARRAERADELRATQCGHGRSQNSRSCSSRTIDAREGPTIVCVPLEIPPAPLGSPRSPGPISPRWPGRRRPPLTCTISTPWLEGARDLRAAFDGQTHLVAYALKANTAGAVVRTFAAEGCGADVVSGAELRVALACGIAPEHIVYNGVAKTDGEIDLALASGARGIGAVLIESVEEIARVEARARAAGTPGAGRHSRQPEPRSRRKDARAHRDRATTGRSSACPATMRRAAAELVESVAAPRARRDVGATSARTSGRSRRTSSRRGCVFGLVRSLRDAGRGRSLEFVDTGGGFGVDYTGDGRAAAARRVRARGARGAARRSGSTTSRSTSSRGGSLVAPHGVLVARGDPAEGHGDGRAGS